MIYDEEWKKFCDWLGIERRRIVTPPAAPRGTEEKFMVISDLHIPFQNKEAIVYAVETGKKLGVNTLIVAGDSVDCYALSRFSKFQNVPIKEEYAEARLFFDYASRNFNKVIVLSGNHEVRERKHFSVKMTPDEMDWLLDRPMLARCVQDMPNVILHKNIIHNVDMNWFIQLGDVIIGHPEKSSSVNLKPVEEFRKWINTWSVSLGFDPLPRLVVIGHTHQAGTTFTGDTMLVENGCLCRFQEYALQANLYPKPQRLAFTVFTMKNNKVDLQSVRQFYPFSDK